MLLGAARTTYGRRCVIHDSVAKSRGETMAETRKIAAILAADMVGFSRLAAADEDRTLAEAAGRCAAT